MKLGLVASLNHPGGNITGVANMGSSLEGKRIQILHDLLPKVRKIGYLTNPDQERQLTGNDTQNALVQAIVEAVLRFRDALGGQT